MADEIKFDVEQVKTAMNDLEDIFNNFAEALKSINDYIETMINAGEDSAILGEYGTKLIQIWNANASSFGDFHANFEAWSETVAIIGANNEDFVVDALALYRDNGSTLDGVKDARDFVAEHGRTGDTSTLSEEALAVMGNASATAAGTSVVHSLALPSSLKVGDSVHAEVAEGLEGDFTYQGLVQRGDMTQEQIYSDKNGNLYYYEDGVMKPVHLETTDYTSESPTYSYDKQATIDDMNNKNLYFQDANGKYTGSNANKTSETTVNTNGSSGANYTVEVGDYTSFNKDNYDGKGTRLLRPSDDFSTYDSEKAKEMITTSVIDVRDNIAQEAVEMQNYLDMNRESLEPGVVKTLEEQIVARNELASQMGKDVQFGWTVEDGVIGDWQTSYKSYGSSNEEGYSKVLDTLDGYQQTLDSFQSIDEIIGNNE